MSRSAKRRFPRQSHKSPHPRRRPLRLEPLETRIALSGVTVAGLSPDDGSSALVLEGAQSLPLADPSGLLPPANITLGWSSKAQMADCLAFDFGDQSLADLSWQVLENGLPIAVDTQLYNGGTSWNLANQHWETEIAAKEFAPGQMSPVVLPTFWAYSLRAQTAGNRYEIQIIRRDPTTHEIVETTTAQAGYGQFKGATADCVNETQTGTITLLELDLDDRSFAKPEFAGVAGARAYQGEQLSTLILDAGTKVNLTIGDLGFRIASMGSAQPLPDLKQASFSVTANREGVITTELSPVVENKCTLTIDTAVLAGNGGMVSLCIRNTNPGSTDADRTAPRYLGIIVEDRDGNVPASPETLTIGAVNENSSQAQQFFRGDAITGASANPVGFQQYDSQYIYLNGGPMKLPDGGTNGNAWRTSSGGYDGKKLIQSVRESMKFGAVPTVVYYNVMCPNESQQIALDNIKNETFMVEYFKDLKFTIETIRSAANGATVALVIEPDFLAYMMQSARTSSGGYNDPDTIQAMTHAAYTAGLLPDPGAGNRLPDTLPGLVEAINRGVRYLATTTEGTTDPPLNLEYGWKFNLWAYDVADVPSLMKATDDNRLKWDAGRTAIAGAAEAVAAWYVKAGILTGETGQTMDFIALDKYGTDGGATGSGYPQTTPGYTDPAAGNYFYNADHWNNYLLYAKTLHEQLNDLPVRLWQIPVGHVNQSTYAVDGQQVSPLANIDKKWEDSAVDFFFGDTFSGKSAGRDEAAAVQFFRTDTLGTVVTYDEQTQEITWSSQMKAAAEAGVQMIMFGPGLAGSTQGGGYSTDPPLDDWFWASKTKDYYVAGALFIERPSVVLNMAAEQSATTGNREIHFTVAFSHAVSGFDAEHVTLNGTTETITGATIGVEAIVDGVEYDVTVTLRDSASTCVGDVSATIAAEMVQDKDGNRNFASTSTANTVHYAPNTIAGLGKSNTAEVLDGGEPLPGVHVSLTSTIAGTFAERTTSTDASGHYQFENVPDGTYQVTVIPPGACLDTGSHSTTVIADGSQTFEADFSFGALKPSCIPNRMMVTSSLPVGSVQWRAVVQEALNLGEGTGSTSVAEASVPAPVQYLVLGPQEASPASSAAVADDLHAINVGLAAIDAEPEPTERVSVGSGGVLLDAPVDTMGEVTTATPIEAQADAQRRPVVVSAVVAIVTSADVPSAEAGGIDARDTVVIQAAGEPDQPAGLAALPTVASANAPTASVAELDVAAPVHAQCVVQPKLLTQAVVAPIVEEAIERWEAAGLDQEWLSKMQNATFLFVNLDGTSLGMAQGNRIWLDNDAAGRGWFVDFTPADDNEFRYADADRPLQAVDPQAVDRIDLLTVVAHELGHVAGLEDSEASGLMEASLKTGLRFWPSVHDAVLASL